MTSPAAPSPIDRRPYRRNVGLALFNPKGLVFAGQRIDNPDAAWQMPQGGIDRGETPVQAALRELQEEIGTDKAEIIAESRGWLAYDFPPDLAPRFWSGRYRGQRQKWFALRFTGQDSDIDIATGHPEFRAWRWMSLDSLSEAIIPFKREIYRAIALEFGPIARKLADSAG